MMQDLQRIYRQALPGRIAALETARANDGADAVAAIRRIAHALRGSGGTYGFPEVSAAAQAVEEAPVEELRTRLDHLIALLRATATEPPHDAEVLIVEDEPESALLFSTALQRPGLHVKVATTAAEARSAIAGGTVSLVLLDLMLPDADGRALLMELRNRYDTADMPIIIVSAKSGAPAKAECFDLGANGFLEKPFEPELLAAVVNAQLRAPRAPAPAAAPAPAVPQTRATTAPILVVEDDDLVASVLKHRLERDGYRIIHCTDGVSAAEILERETISMAILDVKVPGMDGFDLLAHLRARAETAATPVIMLTAMGGEKDVLRGLQLGADDYVTKPFSPVEVLARIKRLLSA